MEGKRTKGRQKIEIKRIEDEDDRLITFSKRRSGIYKKASELATLCGAEVGIVVFSPAGKPFSYGHPSIESIANRYFNRNPPPNDNTHPLVEAHRRVKIQELTQQHNNLVNKLEEEKEKTKLLKQMTKETQGKGWWEAPIEELGMEDLQQMRASMEDLHNKLCNRIKEMTIISGGGGGGGRPAQASASAPNSAPAPAAAAASYLPMNPGHAHALQAIQSDDLFDPDVKTNNIAAPNIPHNYPYGRGFF